jgi:ABC-type multidrug transport system fused ATPase/permease subunit
MSFGTTSPTAALLRAKTRILGRALWENAFTVFVLGPLIVGGFWFILEPTLQRAAEWTQAAALGMRPAAAGAAGLALAAVVTAAGLPSALREVFAIRTPDSTLDFLPLPPSRRFGLIAITQAARNLPTFAAAWAGLALLARAAGGTTAHPVELLGPLLATAMLQVAGGMLLLRWGLFTTARLLALGGALLALAWAARESDVLVWATGPLAVTARFWAAKLSAALHATGEPGVWATQPLQWTAALLLLSAAGWAYARWREEDRQLAEEALAQRRRLLGGLERRLARWTGRPTAALLARDLRLTLRGFVPATAVLIALAALCLTGGFLGGPRLEEAWRPLAAQLGVALACVSMSALAPLMLARQIPMSWIELSAGAPPQSMWKAKTQLALALSVPALLLGLSLGWTLGLDGAGYAAFAARLAMGWLTVGTVLGLLAFEIAASPALGLLLGGLFSIGLCGFYALPDYWPIGLFLYAYVMHMLKERAEHSAGRSGGAALSGAVLAVAGLVKRYHETPAVNDVSFMVEAGEIFGLLGANGAGKSTLLKCALGLVRPTSGEIVVDGLHAARQPLETRRRIGYLPEELRLYERLTGWEFLELVCGLKQVECGAAVERTFATSGSWTGATS